jgi:hypothetical protein
MSLASKQYTPEEEAEMRARGLRPVTIWVPDTSRPGFAEEFRRQAELSANLHSIDPDAESFSEAALADLDLPPYEER